MKKHLHFPSPDPSLSVRFARTRQELASAFELVYRSYLAKGYARAHPGGIIYRQTFGLPSSRTIIATANGPQVVGTLTIVGDNPLGLELETTYPSEVQSLRSEGRRLAELTCLAIQPTADFRPTAVFFALTRFMIHYAYWQGFDDLLLAIHPRHHQLYWRCFRVSRVGPCRPHECVNGSPSICCGIDLHRLKREVKAELPEMWEQYFAREFPETEYLRPPTAPADHHYFACRSGIAIGTGSSGRMEASQDVA